jgi:CPA2 family monovalent cation:H+ antiporter-2
MSGHLAIVAILTVGFTLASLLAYTAQRIRLPPILGYLLAGYLIGPYSPGFVADLAISEQLAEVGVVLMLFGVGLHFKLEDLIKVKNIALPGAIAQMSVATLLAALIVTSAGWSLSAGLIIGLSVGVASTVVLVRMLSDNRLLNTLQGHIAVGWLVVEDIFTVIILILLPTFAALTTGNAFSIIGILEASFIVILKFALLAFLMFTWGQKIIAYILTDIARSRSQELFTLTVLALVFLVAAGSALIFGTSIALGAFIAGMVIGKTTVRHQAAANALPLKDIFAIIFFLSVGMLFNPIAIVSNFTLFMGIISVILIIKPLTAFLITTTFGYSLKVALTVALALAQIGEFSFILAEEALKLKLLPDEGFDILVACAIISISLNPILFQALDLIESKMKKFRISRRAETIIKHLGKESIVLPRAIVVGYGIVGKEISIALKDLRFAATIIEQNIDTVESLEKQDVIIFGDASDPSILKEAYIEQANYLLITIPDSEKAVTIIHAARDINPSIEIITRIQYASEKPAMEELNVNYVCAETEVSKVFTYLTRQLLQKAR